MNRLFVYSVLLAHKQRPRRPLPEHMPLEQSWNWLRLFQKSNCPMQTERRLFIMNNKTVVLISAAFLGVAGSVQMLLEIAGHFAQIGPYAEQFANSPYTIGFFEAHGLAVLTAVALFWHRNSDQLHLWNRFAFTVHLLLGGANLLFWQSFVTFDFLMPGIIATTLHGVLLMANGYHLIRRNNYEHAH